ncbi:MAG TPA: PBP1A family penicillin-binding protein [Bacteroidota bacterium]|nr:PBP1A family penicillin-binding protein [Bacteroidota bacterium]
MTDEPAEGEDTARTPGQGNPGGEETGGARPGGDRGEPGSVPSDMERYFNDPEFRRKKSRRNLWQRMSSKAKVLSALAALLVIVGAIYWNYLVSGLPSLEKVENPKPELASKVYSVDGEVLDQYFIKNRSHLALADIPKPVVDALLATEDKDFYSHWGVDLVRFGKAMVKDLFALRLKEGASTITQQLARNLYLGHHDRNIFDGITRKIREFMTSVQLERTFTKDEILEFYLNVVYFGRGSYGIASASQVYFGKAPADLTLGEVATLIAVLKGPGYYDPSGKHPERVLNRRNTVISQMQKYNYISEEQADQARIEPIQLKPADDVTAAGIAPHFVEYIRQQLMAKAEKYGFDIYRDGIQVYTTLDSRMQKHANQAVEEHLAIYQKEFDKEWDWTTAQDVLARVIDQAIKTSPQYRRALTATGRDSVYAALAADHAWADSMKHVAQSMETGFVALDARTGGILALVGGANFRNFKYGLNHVTQIRRQVGSAFKPFVYTVAVDNGYAPCYELLNQPVTVIMADGKRWTPSNSDGQFGGKSTIRNAIMHSINLVAVRAIMQIAPVNRVIEYARRMGITSPLPPYESLALGAGDIYPIEMAGAFNVFANHGVYVHPYAIVRIEDKDGNVIEENAPMRREVFSEQTAFIMTSMLEGVVNGGTGSRVRDFFQLPAAGKTGTTTEFADAWFVGYTPQISAAVWVGFDNRSVHFKTWNGQGGRAAAPIWGRFMKYVYDDPSIAMPLEYFEKPAGVFADTICTETKKLATAYCPEKMVEYFTDKTRPGSCDKHATSKWREGEQGTGTVSF